MSRARGRSPQPASGPLERRALGRREGATLLAGEKMRKLLVVATLLGLVTLGTALVPPARAGASPPGDYMWVGRDEVALMEFTVSASTVVGVMYTETLEGSSPNAYLQSASLKFTGTDNGGDLTLYLGGRSAVPTFGSVDGGTLSLQFQQNGGALSTVTFYLSSVATYDRYLVQWNAAIGRANAAAAAVAAKAAAAAARKQQLLARLNETIEEVDSDLSSLSSPGELGDDEGDLANDVGDVSNDLGDVQNDMGNVANDLSNDDTQAQVCSDISSSYNDAASTAADAQSIVSDAQARLSGVGKDIQDVQQAMARAPGDYGAYWQAQHALPTYQPTSPIPPLKVALATGQSIIDGAVHQVNSYVTQANGIVAQAYRLVNAANKANHCGPAKAPPVIGHVTPALLGA